MNAILVGKDRELLWSSVPDPQIQEDEVLVEVCAAALNRADLMQRAGDYPPPLGCPEWMGLEISGVIVKAGAVASKYRKVGEQVCALLGGGGYAEYAAVRYDMLMPIPKGVSLVDAAAMPEAFATAYLNLFIEGGVKKGETLLMHAGASGLASVVIPMAKAFGLRVLTSVLTDEIAASITHLRADRVIVSAREDVSEVLKAEMEAGRGIDIAIDCLGGEMAGKCLPYMNRGGRWIMIATLAGDMTQVNLKEMYVRGVRMIGNTLRSRTPQMKAEILAALVRDVWPMVEEGKVLPTIYKVLPIEQAGVAHAILEQGRNVGKVVLTVRR
jgi:NADPH2:quinone reductase